MIVWVVRVERQNCCFEHFSEAWSDFKSHDKALIYPKFMRRKRFYGLKEFNGW